MEFLVEADSAAQVHEIKARLSFASLAQKLAAAGLRAVPLRGDRAKTKETGFPPALKKGVKDACKHDPQAYRDFVTICKDFSRAKISRKQAMTEFKRLLLSTPLERDPKLARIKELVALFRSWTKDWQLRLAPKASAVAESQERIRDHDWSCIMGQTSCFLCVNGQSQHCICCTLFRQLSILRSLEHNAQGEDGCLCHKETRQEKQVRSDEKQKLITNDKMEPSTANSVLDQLELDYGALYPLSQSQGLGSLVLHHGCSNGHTDRVRAIACHPQEEDFIVSGSDDGSIKHWSLSAGRCLATLKHKSGVTSLAWSPCGNVLLSGSDDGVSKVWLFERGAANVAKRAALDAASAWTLRDSLHHHGGQAVNTVAWATCRACLTSIADDCVASNLCGKVFASGSRDHCINLYRYEHIAFDPFVHGVLKTLRNATEEARHKVRQCRLDHAVAAKQLQTARREHMHAEDVYAKRLKLKQEIGQGEEALSKEIADIGAKKEALVDAEALEADALNGIAEAQALQRERELAEEQPTGSVLTATLVGHEDYVTCVAFSPDLSVLASASCDGTVRLWDLASVLERGLEYSGEGVRVLRGHLERVWWLAFSHECAIEMDGRTYPWLASCSEDKTVRLWDLSLPLGYDQDTVVHTGNSGCICDTPTNMPQSLQQAESGSSSPQPYKMCAGAAFVGLADDVRSVAFSQDDTILLVASGESIKLFSLANGQELMHAGAGTGEGGSPLKGSPQKTPTSPGEARYFGHLSGTTSDEAPDVETDAGMQDVCAAASTNPAPEKRVAAAADPEGFTTKKANATCVRCLHRRSTQEAIRAVGEPASLTSHRGQVQRAIFHPSDPEVVCSCGADCSVKVWLVARRTSARECFSSGVGLNRVDSVLCNQRVAGQGQAFQCCSTYSWLSRHELIASAQGGGGSQTIPEERLSSENSSSKKLEDGCHPANTFPVPLSERLVRRLDACAKKLEASARRCVLQLCHAEALNAQYLQGYARRALARGTLLLRACEVQRDLVFRKQPVPDLVRALAPCADDDEAAPDA